MTKQAKPASKQPGKQTAAAEPESKPAPPSTPKPAPGPEAAAGPKAVAAGARPAPPRARWTLVAAAVVVAFVLGASLWPLLLPRLGLTLPAPELEARLATLEARAVEGDRLGRAVGGEVAGVAASLTALEGRLARLETEAGVPAPELEGLRAELDRLGQRLAALEAVPPPPPSDLAPDDRLTARLRALEGALAAAAEGAEVARDLERRLSRLDKRIDGLQAGLAGAGGDGALAVAVGQLKAALSSSGAYRSSLAAVAALAGDDPELEPALAALAPYAAPGVPTIAGLGATFAGLADRIVRAETVGGGDDWLGLVEDWARRLVSLRRTGELAGEATEARVARAERRLEAGDLAAAVEELAALEGAAAEAVSAWLPGARARLAADRALSALERRVIARLGGADGEPR